MELIKISNEGGEQTVSLRDLWLELKSKQEFANWKNSRLEGFIEGYDFLTTLSKSTGGRPSKEFHVTIEAAKHISMMERNKEGMRVRKYFIECEKKSQVIKQPTMLDYAHALIDAHKVIEKQQPAVDFTKAMTTVEDSIKVGELAKMLFSKNIKIGQNRLFKWLYENKYLMDSSTPYQKYMDMGLFEIVTGVIERSTTGKIWKTIKVTGKGIVHITQKLQESEEFKIKKELSK